MVDERMAGHPVLRRGILPRQRRLQPEGVRGLLYRTSGFDGLHQPTDYTLKTQPIAGEFGGGVEVTVEDVDGNLVADGTLVTMSIGVDPSGSAELGGTKTQGTVFGVATFTDLTIDTTSSGFTLHAVAGAASADSDEFAITNTDSSCTDCTATFPNGSTVSAPAGTILVIETNQLDCSGVTNDIAGTVTIIPTGTGVIVVEFIDTIDLPVGGPVPFCKTSGPPEDESVHTVPLCASIPDGFDRPDGTEPCVTESVEFTGPTDTTATLRSRLYMDSFDPRARH